MLTKTEFGLLSKPTKDMLGEFKHISDGLSIPLTVQYLEAIPMLVSSIPSDHPYKYLIRDRDQIYAAHLDRSAESRRNEALEREVARLRRKLERPEQILEAQTKLCELLGLSTGEETTR
ncbi:MAG: hypothetical protein M3436_16850 [Pseudomonadota bacterium]|nr:hypothetical protein [Pseudomonadota bacterium]